MSGQAELSDALSGKAGNNFFATRREVQNYLPAVVLRAFPPQERPALQAVRELDHAVMAKLHTFGEFLYAGLAAQR
jgi:hypothetical protein